MPWVGIERGGGWGCGRCEDCATSVRDGEGDGEGKGEGEGARRDGGADSAIKGEVACAKRDGTVWWWKGRRGGQRVVAGGDARGMAS